MSDKLHFDFIAGCVRLNWQSVKRSLRFLQGPYLILVSRSKKLGRFGHHNVYAVEHYHLVELFDCSAKMYEATRKDELRSLLRGRAWLYRRLGSQRSFNEFLSGSCLSQCSSLQMMHNLFVGAPPPNRSAHGWLNLS